MRSSTFFTLLCLFPVFISAFSTVLHRDDPSSNSTLPTDPSDGNSTTSANSTSSAPPTDGGSGNSTLIPPDGGSNSTSPSAAPSNSTPTPTSSVPPLSVPTSFPPSNVTTDPVALELMQTSLQLNKYFYNTAIQRSNSLNDPTVAALLASAELINQQSLQLLNQSTSDNCTFDLSHLLDNNPLDFISSAVYLELITQMGVLAVLENTSIPISTADQTGMVAIISDASVLATIMGNATSPGVPLNVVPQITYAEFANFLRKFNPSCVSPSAFESLPETSISGFGTPFTAYTQETLTIGATGCPNTTAQAFCQVIGSDPTANATVVPVEQCNAGPKDGVILLYITDSEDPLSPNPEERVSQQSRICMGPEILVVQQ